MSGEFEITKKSEDQKIVDYDDIVELLLINKRSLVLKFQKNQENSLFQQITILPYFLNVSIKFLQIQKI